MEFRNVGFLGEEETGVPGEKPLGNILSVAVVGLDLLLGLSTVCGGVHKMSLLLFDGNSA